MSFAMDEEKEKKGEIITTKVEKKKKHINKDLIKTMAVLASKIKSSVLGNIKCYFISLYYYHNYATKFEYNPKIKPVYLFNKEITQNNADEIKDILNTFLYMTYRTNFTNLKTIGLGNYTTDCGWGCMIRCSQVAPKQGFYRKKNF